MRLRPILIVVAFLNVAHSQVAVADDGGDASDAAADADLVSDASESDASDAAEDALTEEASAGNAAPTSGTPGGSGFSVACDGGLCDTTTGSQCGVAVGSARRARHDPDLWIATAVAVAILGARRTWRRASRPYVRTAAS
ncbi:MAG: hypothetical protein WBY94_06145 [Polyangiaceae bacterium]